MRPKEYLVKIEVPITADDDTDARAIIHWLFSGSQFKVDRESRCVKILEISTGGDPREVPFIE